jgi:hypothetical protein
MTNRIKAVYVKKLVREPNLDTKKAELTLSDIRASARKTEQSVTLSKDSPMVTFIEVV